MRKLDGPYISIQSGTSVDGLVLARQGVVRLNYTTYSSRFSVRISLTAVRNGARVPSTDIAEHEARSLQQRFPLYAM